MSILVAILAAATLTGCSKHITESSDSYDAGVIFSAKIDRVEHTFQFRNTTGRPLKIIDEKHSCSCTNVDLEKRELKPGESTPVRMTARIAPAYVKMDLQCTLITQPKLPKDITYHLRFECYPEIEASTNDLDLGVIPWNRLEQKSIDLELSFYDPSDRIRTFPRPIRCVSTCDELKPILSDIEKTEKINDLVTKRSYYMKVRFNPNLSSAIRNEQLFWKLSDGRSVSQSVSWRVESLLKTENQFLSFGVVRGAKIIQKRIEIVASDRRTFCIMNIEKDSKSENLLNIETEIDKMKGQTMHHLDLTLQYHKNDKPGLQGGAVRIFSDIPGDPGLEIHWSAYIVGEAFSSTQSQSY